MKLIRYICLLVASPDRRRNGSESRRRVPFHPAGGFTILELMTVVGIIAILSAIAVYSINTNLDRIRADTAVRRVSLALNYARIRAVAENCNYIVTFLVRPTVSKGQSRSYIEMLADIDKDGIKDSGETTRIEDLPGGIIYDLDGQPDINNIAADAQNRDGIAFSDNKVTFLPRGNADEGGEVYIIPEKSLERNINQNRRAISLERLSGRTIGWFYHTSLADAGKNPWKEEGK
jgi:prepilin-type N-terminal cleavage/methylation domain-containing protein